MDIWKMTFEKRKIFNMAWSRGGV